MTPLMRRVVKVGGSLESSTSLVEDLRRWIARQSASEWWFVIGGGSAIDAIHARQKCEGFDDGAAHWLCIRAMQANAVRLAELMPELIYPASLVDWSAMPSEPRWLLLDPWRFLREDDARRSAKPLPESWDVSSDSIAARVARLTGADELVLLKSTLPRDVSTSGEYVDPYFEMAARELSCIRFVNLRDPEFAEVRYR